MRRALAQAQGFLRELNCVAAGCSRGTRWHRCKDQRGRLQRGNTAVAGTHVRLLRSARVLPSEVLDRHCLSCSAQLAGSNFTHCC